MKYKAVMLVLAILLSGTIASFHCTDSFSTQEFEKPKVIIYSGGFAYSMDNLSTLKRMLENKGFNVTTVDKITSFEIFENTQLLVMIGSTNITKELVNLTRLYIEEGGTVLLAPYYKKPGNYSELLKFFGLEFGSKLVRDNESYFENDTAIIRLQAPNSFSNEFHPISSGISDLIIPHCVPIKFIGNASLKIIFHNYTLLWGQNSTYVDLNDNEKPDENEPRGNNVTLAVAIEMWSGGKVVIFGSSEFFLDSYINKTQNDILVDRIIDWLTGRRWVARIIDLRVSQKIIYIGETKFINVSFNVTDTTGKPITNATIWVLLYRAGIIVRNITINATGQIHYEVSFDLSGINQGEYFIRVLVYKQSWGFFWSEPLRISIRKRVLVPKLDPISLALWLAIVAIGLVFYIRCLPYIRKQKQIVREFSEKIQKKEEKT